MKVIQVLTYEGPEEWLEQQLASSMPDGVRSGAHGRNYPPTGGTITIATVHDERPSQQVSDPTVLKAVEEAKRA